MNRLTVFIIEGHSKSRVEEFLRQIDEVRRKEEEEKGEEQEEKEEEEKEAEWSQGEEHAMKENEKERENAVVVVAWRCGLLIAQQASSRYGLQHRIHASETVGAGWTGPEGSRGGEERRHFTRRDRRRRAARSRIRRRRRRVDRGRIACTWCRCPWGRESRESERRARRR